MMPRWFVQIRLAAAVSVLACGTGAAQQHAVTLLKDESWMKYTVSHPLHTVEATSKDVNYTLTLDSTLSRITSVAGTVDVTTFDSQNSNRDSHAMEVIDAITYPDASFASTSVTETGDSLVVSGKMTFHGVTKEIISSGTAKWSPGKVAVSERFNISMTSFGIDRPSLLLMPVEDTIHFSLQAVFQIQ